MMKFYLILFALLAAVSAGIQSRVDEFEKQSALNSLSLNLPSSVLTDETISVKKHEEIVEGEYEGEKQLKLQQNIVANIKCGIRPHVKSGRIVGGKDAAFGAWPWQALIRELDENGSFTQSYYGGVLISEKYVLSVAHWAPGPNSTVAVVFGEFDLSTDKSPAEKKPIVIRKVRRYIVHPEYNNQTLNNDLALLELESPIQFDTHIVPICLPIDGQNFTGRIATVTGWGSLLHGGGFPTILQEVQVPIIDSKVCQDMIQSCGYTKEIAPSSICAGYANGERDSCIGDSGGPLVLERPNGQWELVGTVSNGIKCGAPNLPGVYMRTTHYLPWIKDVAKVSNM